MQVDLNKKKILITGGTGTLGKILIKKLLKDFPFIEKLVVFSRDEYKQSKLARKYQDHAFLQFVIGDVRDKEKLLKEFKDIDIVIHAAAMKCLDVCERNPEETYKTNVAGTINVIEASRINKVEKVLFISTDKAVEPISIYGESKAKGEQAFLDASGKSETQFAVLRLGNIFNSRGSVFTAFAEQSETGKLVVFDRKSTRYLITNKQLYKSVLHALSYNFDGIIVIPKLKIFKVIDLANTVCNTCEITILPLRQGEREHEYLFSANEVPLTYEDDAFFYLVNNGKKLESLNTTKTELKEPLSSEEGIFFTPSELHKMILNQ